MTFKNILIRDLLFAYHYSLCIDKYKKENKYKEFRDLVENYGFSISPEEKNTIPDFPYFDTYIPTKKEDFEYLSFLGHFIDVFRYQENDVDNKYEVEIAVLKSYRQADSKIKELLVDFFDNYIKNDEDRYYTMRFFSLLKAEYVASEHLLQYLSIGDKEKDTFFYGDLPVKIHINSMDKDSIEIDKKELKEFCEKQPSYFDFNSNEVDKIFKDVLYRAEQFKKRFLEESVFRYTLFSDNISDLDLRKAKLKEKLDLSDFDLKRLSENLVFDGTKKTFIYQYEHFGHNSPALLFKIDILDIYDIIKA
jgi:hypothetical protein